MLNMTWTALSFFGLALLVGSCIGLPKQPKIIEGQDANIKQFPFLVSLRYRGEHICGGTIISDRHILTAAHCVQLSNPSKILTIVTATSRSDRVGKVYKVSAVDTHPTYQRRYEVDGSDDIAVITLQDSVVFDKLTQKIDLPTRDVKNNDAGYAIGWGRDSKNSWDSAIQLQKLKVALIPSETCKPFLTQTTIDNTQVCIFRSVSTGVCHGDSGSTLVAHGQVVGVASRIDIGQCAAGMPDIYTNVFSHLKFIETVMNKTQ